MRYPVLKKQCATCPFRKDSPYRYLAPDLAISAAVEASRICHNTGEPNAVNDNPKGPPMLCRGARDLQLQMFFGMGFLDAPTDEAWEARCQEMGL